MFCCFVSHNDSVLCLAFNPVSHTLASCSANDLAFWSADQKAIQKHKLGIKITCCAWTNDGQYIALGLQSGSVSIRNKVRIYLTHQNCVFNKSFF